MKFYSFRLKSSTHETKKKLARLKAFMRMFAYCFMLTGTVTQKIRVFFCMLRFYRQNNYCNKIDALSFLSLLAKTVSSVLVALTFILITQFKIKGFRKVVQEF